VSDETKICPWCAESIKAAAIVCRYCGRDLPHVETDDADQLKRLREDYGAVFEVAWPLVEALPEPPQNRIAWTAELCKRIAGGSPPDAAAARIPLEWGAIIADATGPADFRSKFPNRGPIPVVSGSFTARISAIGDVRGYTKEDLLEILGPPNAISATQRGCQLLQWQKVSAFGRSYHYALIFDRNGYCGGITHEFVR